MTEFYRIYQKIEYDTVKGELLDRDNITLGYVDNEFFAIEFCNTHDDCDYDIILCTKYINQLEGAMVSDDEDLDYCIQPYKVYD